MTIEIQGHLQAMRNYGINKVVLTIGVESERLPGGHEIEIVANKTEIDSYQIGMQIQIQIRPSSTR